MKTEDPPTLQVTVFYHLALKPHYQYCQRQCLPLCKISNSNSNNITNTSTITSSQASRCSRVTRSTRPAAGRSRPTWTLCTPRPSPTTPTTRWTSHSHHLPREDLTMFSLMENDGTCMSMSHNNKVKHQM